MAGPICMTNFRMDWEFASATDGNVALMGELDIRHGHEWVLAIGFGASGEEAAHAAIKSLRRGWKHAHKRYLQRLACILRQPDGPQYGKR